MQNQGGNSVPEPHSDGGGSDSYYPDSESPPASEGHAPVPQTQRQVQQQYTLSSRGPTGPAAAAAAVAAPNSKNSHKDTHVKIKKKVQLQREEMGEARSGDEADGTGRKRRRGVRGTAAAATQRLQDFAATATSTGEADTQRVTIYLFFFFGFVNLLFVLLNCTLSQLDVRGGACYTYWGFKANCDATSYTVRSNLLSDGRMRSALQAGAAMSIIGIIGAVGVFAVSWLLVVRARVAVANRRHNKLFADEHTDNEETFHDLDGDAVDGAAAPKKDARYIEVGMLKWAAVGFMGVNLFFSLIAWGIIAGLYSDRPGEDRQQPRGITYGVGFGLGITTWIIQIIMLVCFIVLV